MSDRIFVIRPFEHCFAFVMLFFFTSSEIPFISDLARFLCYFYVLAMMAISMLRYRAVLHKLKALKYSFILGAAIFCFFLFVFFAPSISRAANIFFQILVGLFVFLSFKKEPKYYLVLFFSLFLVFWCSLSYLGFLPKLFLSNNYLGMVGFYIFGISVLVDRYSDGQRKLLFALSIAIFYFSESRSVVIAAAWFYVCLFLVGVNLKKMAILMTVVVCTVMTGLYVLNPVRDVASDVSAKISEKGVESGRQVIWQVAMLRIVEKPMLGYGLGAMPTDFSADSHYANMSIHNHHLQLIYQIGFLGLFVFLVYYSCLLLNISNLNMGRNFSIGLAILVQQTFEVSLTQNNLPLLLAYWCLIGYKFSEVKHD